MDSYQAIYDAVCSRVSRCDVGAAVADVARNAFDISHVIVRAQEQVYVVSDQMQRPSVLYRPRIYIDGNRWCALYGDNLKDGVVGFGDCPAEAMASFDEAWRSERTPDAKRETSQ